MRISAGSFFEMIGLGFWKEPAAGRSIELAAVCVLVGTIIWWPPKLVMVFLAAAVTVVAGLVALRQPAWAELGFRRDGFEQSMWIGLPIVTLCLVGLIVVHAGMGRPILPMLQIRPGSLAILVLFYPLNVLGQEFVFRSAFYWRYGSLLSNSMSMALNAAIFGWVHVIYGSWVPVVVASLGGILFAAMYRRYRNIWGITVIHALLGLLIFAAGYGEYFSN